MPTETQHYEGSDVERAPCVYRNKLGQWRPVLELQQRCEKLEQALRKMCEIDEFMPDDVAELLRES